MSTWKSPKWTKVSYVELCGSAAEPRMSYSGCLTLTAVTVPAKCKALLLLPAEMATGSPVSSKFHCFYIVSYLANLTGTFCCLLFFFFLMHWLDYEKCRGFSWRSGSPQSMERALLKFSPSPHLLHWTHFPFCIGHSGVNEYPVP